MAPKELLLILAVSVSTAALGGILLFGLPTAPSETTQVPAAHPATADMDELLTILDLDRGSTPSDSNDGPQEDSVPRDPAVCLLTGQSVN